MKVALSAKTLIFWGMLSPRFFADTNIRDAQSLATLQVLSKQRSSSWLLAAFRVLITDRLHTTVCNLVQVPTTPTQSSRTGGRPTNLVVQEYLYQP